MLLCLGVVRVLVFLGVCFCMRKFGILAVLSSLLFVGPARADFSCSQHPGYSAIDLSQPVTSIETANGKSNFTALKALGIKTIVRYYGWPEAEMSCKILLPDESDAILAAGFKLVTVFQRENDDPETFFNLSRGTTDAKRALEMAGANGQPAGSAIYFSVDGVDQTIRDMVFEHGMSNGHAMSHKRQNKLIKADHMFRRHIRHYARFLQYQHRVFRKPVVEIVPQDMHPAFEHYFQSIKTEFAKDPRYKIGAYGSGAVCELLLNKGLVDYCWLAQSTGWPGYDHFYKSRRWSMVQQNSTICSNMKFRGVEKVRFDFNKVSTLKNDIGQWSKKDEIKEVGALPKLCTLNW